MESESHRCVATLETWRRCADSWIFAIVAAILFIGARNAVAETPALAEAPLERKLAERVSVSWNGQELGTALARLTELKEIPLWVDRRVDPTATVELALHDQSVSEALDLLTADKTRDWGWTSLRTVVYFGPRQTARDLATLSELARLAIAKTPADARRKLLAAVPWEFPRLSEPRKLLEETFASVGSELRAVDLVPHDVWAARSLPAVAPIDRVALILAGFDLTIAAAPDGRKLSVAPIARPVQLTREYRFSDQVAALAAELASQDEAMRVRRQGRQLVVSGRWEDQERLRTVARGNGAAGETPAESGSSPPADVTAKRFTLKIMNKPVEPVLKQLAAQLQLAIVWDPALDVAKREALVSCDVHEIGVDGLLKAILEPAGLAFVRNGQTVTIQAAK